MAWPELSTDWNNVVILFSELFLFFCCSNHFCLPMFGFIRCIVQVRALIFSDEAETNGNLGGISFFQSVAVRCWVTDGNLSSSSS